MNIEVRKLYEYCDVKVRHENISIDLGMMDEDECRDFAKHLIETVWQLGPDSPNECGAWLASIIHECGIELPEAE